MFPFFSIGITESSQLHFLWKTVRDKGKAWIIGPKGVGKTFSLLFLVCCYLTEAFVYITSNQQIEHKKFCKDFWVRFWINRMVQFWKIGIFKFKEELILIDIDDTKEEHLLYDFGYVVVVKVK